VAKAFYPGSFDPITNGHLDIIKRSLAVFDELTVVVAGTPHKLPLFSQEERVEILRQVLKPFPNVKVDSHDGLIMEYAGKKGISAMVRGLRAASDFEYEFMMASMNKKINSSVETVFMMTSSDLYFVSSSMVKELHRYGGDISSYVPPEVTAHLNHKVTESR